MLTLSPDNLKQHTYQAYEALEKAVSTQNYKDAFDAKKRYNGLFDILTAIMRPSSFLTLEIGTKLPNSLDSYILVECVLGWLPSSYLERTLDVKRKNFGWTIPIEDHGITPESFRSALNNKKTRYWEIKNMAYLMAIAGRYDWVLEAIQYVRNLNQEKEPKAA